MYKNNFRAILIHIIIGLIIFKLFTYIDSLAIENKIKFGGFFYDAGAIFFFLLAIILYLSAGRVLSMQGNKLKDLLSVSSVSIVGLILWLVCFTITGGINTGANLNWIPFVFYTAYSFPLNVTFYLDTPFMAFIYALAPSLLMWASIQLLNRRSGAV
ncbi:MAG: hypothetical protein ACOYVK_04415 [Bacillota bacterium]